MSTEGITAEKKLGWGDCSGVERDPDRLAGALDLQQYPTTLLRHL